MQIINYAHKQFWGHVISWLFFICYELGLTYYSAGRLDPVYIYVAYYAVNILFFYIHIRILNFTFSTQKPRYFKGTVFFLLLFICCVLIKFILIYFLENPQHAIKYVLEHLKPTIANTVIRIIFFTLLATFYWLASHITYYRKQSLEAERLELIMRQEKSEALVRLSQTQNAYLQQQINPHMLFNSLNFIYNSVHKCSEEAAQSVLLLTDIMRFSLEGAGADGKAPLADEIEQINNLIEINRQRFDEELFLHTHVQGSIEKFRILPLVLFTLTENIFKHGNLINRQYPAMLVIHVGETGELRYYAKNWKKSKSSFQRNSSLGIQNIRTRMDFAYPGKYDLTLSDQETFFETTLNVIL
jgi:sensor histidine kinase YesM